MGPSDKGLHPDGAMGPVEVLCLQSTLWVPWQDYQVIQGAFVTLALGGGVEVLHLQITLCVQWPGHQVNEGASVTLALGWCGTAAPTMYHVCPTARPSGDSGCLHNPSCTYTYPVCAVTRPSGDSGHLHNLCRCVIQGAFISLALGWCGSAAPTEYPACAVIKP